MTSCSMTGASRRTSRSGDEARGDGRLRVWRGAGGLQASLGLMRQTWGVLRTSPTPVCPQMRKLVHGRVCGRMRELFCRQAREGVSDQDRRWAVEATAGVRGVIPVRRCPRGVENDMQVELDGRRGDLPRPADLSSNSQHHPRDDQRRSLQPGLGGRRMRLAEEDVESKGRWVAEPFQYHQDGRVARRWRWRRIRRGARLPTGWRELSGVDARVTESPGRGESDPGLYPVVPTGGGASRVLDDEGVREVGISVPGLIGGVVGTGPDLRFKGGIFLTIMSVVTQHLVWLTARLKCSVALLIRRFWIFLNRMACACEDFWLDEPMAVCLMAVQCLAPGAWDSINHLSTSPKPKRASITPQVLQAGIGEVGCYRITEEEWDEVVPPEFLNFMRTFDLRSSVEGNGRVRAPVRGITDAIRQTGVLHDEPMSLSPTCFPFMIPKNEIKCSLILSCVGIHKGMYLKPPKFSLASWENIGRWMAEQDQSVQLYGTHIDLTNAYWSFLLPPKAQRIFRFYTSQDSGLVSLDRLPFGWAFSPFLCQQLLGKVVQGAVPDGVFLVHYLDDFILLSANIMLLSMTTEEVAERIRRAVFLVSLKSTLTPVQVLKALGKVVNLKERRIQVQPFVFLQLIVAWIRLATCGYSKRRLDKLLGTLQWHLRPRRGFSGLLAGSYAWSRFGPETAAATPVKVLEGLASAIAIACENRPELAPDFCCSYAQGASAGWLVLAGKTGCIG